MLYQILPLEGVIFSISLLEASEKNPLKIMSHFLIFDYQLHCVIPPYHHFRPQREFTKLWVELISRASTHHMGENRLT